MEVIDNYIVFTAHWVSDLNTGKLKCSNCGKTFEWHEAENTEFCSKCGRKISNE